MNDDDLTTAYMTGFHKRDDEIERLRHEVKLREQICADATLYARRLQEADDEIERLRGAYEQERKDCINLTEKVMPNLRAEIERLRTELAIWKAKAPAHELDRE